MTVQDEQFLGFSKPKSNYSKLPHVFVEYLPRISSLAELKVLLYILRHTWGYSEFDRPKRITLDEFQNGRKKKDGERLDSGIGMSINAIKDGIRRAVEQGFIIQTSDGRDKARSSHEYTLNMRVSEVDPLPSEVDPRSEKETTERNKTTGADAPALPAPPVTPEPVQEKKQSTPAQAMFTALAEVCQIDLTTLTENQRGALNQSGKKLRQASAGPTELTAFCDWWYAYDWRGKRGEPPRPHQVRETWGQFLIHDNGGGHNARQSSNPRAPNYSPPLATRATA